MKNNKIESKDLSLERLVKLYSSGNITIPKYQRSIDWNKTKKIKFINSVLHKSYIPPLVLRDLSDDLTTKYNVIDGQQRLHTISAFMNDEFRISSKAPSGFTKKYYSELSDGHKTLVDGITIKCDIVTYETDKQEQQLFRDLNSTPSLNHAQIRNSLMGDMRNLIINICGHKFFEEKCISSMRENKKMIVDALCAELVNYTYYKASSDSPKILYSMYTDNVFMSKDVYDQTLKKIHLLLDKMNRVFVTPETYLNKSFTKSCILFLNDCDTSGTSDEDLYNFLDKFSYAFLEKDEQKIIIKSGGIMSDMVREFKMTSNSSTNKNRRLHNVIHDTFKEVTKIRNNNINPQPTL